MQTKNMAFVKSSLFGDAEKEKAARAKATFSKLHATLDDRKLTTKRAVTQHLLSRMEGRRDE
jgi:hypothetical protein